MFLIEKNGTIMKSKRRLIMKKTAVYFFTVVFVLSFFRFSYSSPWDLIKNKLNTATSTKLSDTKVGSGLKEALKVGIENTIKLLGKTDGYFGNQSVKILMPESTKKVEPALRAMGLGPKIDEFVLSMNRAAEKSTPLAADIFATAITEMSFDDARKILQGGGTAATDYFKTKTYDKLLAAFQPAVRASMDDYAVTRKFEEITGKVQAIPFADKVGNVDVNRYVSSKALDGLFLVLGQQENKIRTDPAARVTDLLKEVFK
jgi:hypothetical protein